MTRIRASCPRCGEVELGPGDLRVRLVADAAGVVRDGSSYRFTCPACEEDVTKPADARIVSLLRGGGVEVDVVQTRDLEAELDTAATAHPEDPPDGPPLTLDDVIALHALLTRADWFDRLLAEG